MQRGSGLGATTAERDLVVVGAGPAGCSAAFFAVRHGFDVLLLDRATFPRDKVCGDGITGAAQLILDRMGVLPAIERCNPWRSRRLVVHSPGGAVMDGSVPSVPGMPKHSLILPRKQLDRVLMEHVVAEKIPVMQGCDIDRLIVEDGRVRGVAGNYLGKRIEIRAKYVVAADGANSRIAGQLSLKNRIPKHHALGIRAYFENVDGLEDGVEMHYHADLIPAYTAVALEIDRGIGVAVFKLSGALSAGAVCSAIAGLRAHPDFTPGMNVLVIFEKGCATRLSVVDTMRVVDYSTCRVEQFGSGYRLALVVSSAADFGLARMYQVWSEGLPREARIFHSLIEAQAWVSANMPVSGVRLCGLRASRAAATRRR